MIFGFGKSETAIVDCEPYAFTSTCNQSTLPWCSASTAFIHEAEVTELPVLRNRFRPALAEPVGSSTSDRTVLQAAMTPTAVTISNDGAVQLLREHFDCTPAQELQCGNQHTLVDSHARMRSQI